MKVIAKNSFHNTEAHLSVKEAGGNGKISPDRARKLRKELCASDCICFGEHTKFFQHIPGYRNSENRQIRLAHDFTRDGGILLETI